MSRVVYFTRTDESIVSRVSVQVSEYSPENGGADPETGVLYAVETLFTDGTWTNEGYFRDLAEAYLKADQVVIDRSAVLLSESLWPNRKVIGGTA